MPAVLDASALLAYVLDEPGAEAVVHAMLDGDAYASAVNHTEVLTRLIRRDEGLVERIAGGWRPEEDYIVEAFNEQDAASAAQLYPRTPTFALSLGDRACLALGHRFEPPVLTDDRVRGGLDRDAIGVEVRVMR